MALSFSGLATNPWLFIWKSELYSGAECSRQKVRQRQMGAPAEGGGFKSLPERSVPDQWVNFFFPFLFFSDPTLNF